VSSPAALGAGDDVLDVEVAAPDEVLGDLEADDRRCLVLILVEGADDSVPAAPLDVDARDQGVQRSGVRSQLEQGGRGTVRLSFGDFADLAHEGDHMAARGAAVVS
jgi:hypothetical protein